jgi:hypothetical protein
MYDKNNKEYKMRCGECLTVTVSKAPLKVGEPCVPCHEEHSGTKPTEDSYLLEYWKPFPDSA